MGVVPSGLVTLICPIVSTPAAPPLLINSAPVICLNATCAPLTGSPIVRLAVASWTKALMIDVLGVPLTVVVVFSKPNVPLTTADTDPAVTVRSK